MKFAGEVVSVDVAAKTFVAKDKKGEKTFDATNAKFGKGVKLEDLKAGDKLSVKFEEKDGKNVATYVGKAAPKAKKAPKQPKEEKPAAEPAAEPATK
jgi:microtubule-associated protein 1